ncbi:MAG TPA: LytR C-terminal domain-containing protein [Polyangia bacterium]|nr:LytR C-terminal domain-containing protein [Polyangia bacterium]
MRKSLLLALLLLAKPALAGQMATHHLLGWTTDGTQFAYVAIPDDCGEPNDFGSSGSVTYGVVVDGRTGLVAQRFFLELDGEAKPDERKRFKAMPNKAAFEAWQKEHPLSCSTALTSPDGKARADVLLKGKDVKGKWKKNEFVFGFEGDDLAEEKRAAFTLAVVRDGKTIPSASWSASSPMAAQGAGLNGSIEVCWAPNGRRIMWSAIRKPGMMRDTGDHVLIIGSTGGPRIQLVADKSVLEQAAAAVGAALDAAGFTPTSAKASNEKVARAATVVYAAAGFEDAAKQVAAAVPGGATVAALDWKAPFDVIVGIGQSAIK